LHTPAVPPPRLFLIGASPVVAALARLAPVLDFGVVQIDEGGLAGMQPDERSAVLVATHGEYDGVGMGRSAPAGAAAVIRRGAGGAGAREVAQEEETAQAQGPTDNYDQQDNQ
jgi:hypothetical protein